MTDEDIDKLRGLNSAGAKGKVGISGTFTFRDKDGRVVKVMEVNGSVPLERVKDGTDDSGRI